MALDTAGAVVIEGPRACGKTMTALNAAASYVFLDDDVSRERLSVAPDSLLDGPTPRLVDEWQVAPGMWNRVRRRVDKAGHPGLFILTGSAVPKDDDARHTGTGRFLRLRQRTLSWWELHGEPTGVSLAALFNGEKPETSDSKMTLSKACTALTTPGFPAMSTLPPQASARLLRGYLEEIAHTDVKRLGDLRHDPVVIGRLLKALARATASEATLTSLRADVAQVAPSIKLETVAKYVERLQRLFVVERQDTWPRDFAACASR
ncbi:ATP-binding protein [Corynebacterium phocae]|uniref:ATP-binding protein n=1 Tax=Corynebacterium phocae TaxID=161895 RepID=UPI000950F788|nr:AAA family ATPase [Corynebacterium phocae]